MLKRFQNFLIYGIKPGEVLSSGQFTIWLVVGTLIYAIDFYFLIRPLIESDNGIVSTVFIQHSEKIHALLQIQILVANMSAFMG